MDHAELMGTANRLRDRTKKLQDLRSAGANYFRTRSSCGNPFPRLTRFAFSTFDLRLSTLNVFIQSPARSNCIA